MGNKLEWTGLAMILISPVLGAGTIVMMAGAVILAIGVVLMWMDK